MRSSGDAVLGLIVDPRRHDRMAPVIRFSDVRGHRHIIEISAAEVRDLCADAHKMLDADAEQVRQWWTKLGSGASRPQAAMPR